MDPFFEDYGADFHLIHLTHSGNLGVMHIHPHYEMFLLTDSFDATFCIIHSYLCYHYTSKYRYCQVNYVNYIKNNKFHHLSYHADDFKKS